ncbi:SPASM domain-containing protein [Odoribacter splanchnicus]|nr:SPASM domain-containing protein [Odoribacter splanchnicus]
MKYSRYNIPVEVGDNRVLVFNSFRKSYSVTSSTFWNKYFRMDDINSIEEPILLQMRDNGFVIDDDDDEYTSALNCKIATRLQTDVYHVVINPTLDCNLCCWYCYETHKKGSHIDQNTEIGILNHLELKFSVTPFKYLHLSFFGGEPFLRHKQVGHVINSIKSFCIKKGVTLRVDFTTNGTIWSPLLIEELRDITSVSFQITLDGSISQHDKVRCLKNGGGGTYKRILENINKIFIELPNAHVTIRINFDDTTFDMVEALEKELLSFPPSQFRVALHKVWQVDANTIKYEQIFDFINTLQEHNIDVRFLDFSHGETTCYADKINSVVINYDGSIYKCTARNFNSDNKVGKLLKTGEISWDYSKLKEYCFASIPSKCQACKIFPICTGICSQKVIEMGDQTPCMIESQFSIEDYILYNYKVNQILSIQKS